MEHIVGDSMEKIDLIEKIIIGGSKLEYGLEEKLKKSKSEIFETFGMSETLTHIAIRPINGVNKSDYFKVLHSFHWEVNKDATLKIKAAHLGRTSINTTDIVRKIDASHFLWVGRNDNVINTGGVKVFPEEIERKLDSLISMPFQIAKEKDEILGEKVVLLVEQEYKEKIKLFELDFSCLKKYEIPKKIVFIPHFSRNDNGKLIRFTLDE
jgi:O-succinylbenzoic acid--CoA ligase